MPTKLERYPNTNPNSPDCVASTAASTAAQEAHLLQRGGDIDLVGGRGRIRVRVRVAHLLERRGAAHLVSAVRGCSTVRG